MGARRAGGGPGGGGGEAGGVGGEGDEGAELVALAVGEELGDAADDGGDEELDGVVLAEVLFELEDFEVAEEGFDVAGHLAVAGGGFDDEVEVAVLEVEVAVGEGEVVDLGDVEADQ